MKLTARAIQAQAEYRDHNSRSHRCHCEYCTYTRDVLAAMDREKRKGAAPRPEGPGAERSHHR
jgi:hypothetical protein